MTYSTYFSVFSAICQYSFHVIQFINVKIRLSEHLTYRVKIRKINKSIPRKILKNPEYIFYDQTTNHWIAIKDLEYAGKIRPMVAVYDKINGDIEIITVYPTDKKEISSRVEKGRWSYEEQKN